MKQKLITLTCTVLNWQASGYSSSDFIQLSADEVFDGMNNAINLAGVTAQLQWADIADSYASGKIGSSSAGGIVGSILRNKWGKISRCV